MQFSSPRQRSLATQTGRVTFEYQIKIDNATGYLEVGIAGAENLFFTFQSGQIIDPLGNFVDSYLPNEVFQISGQVLSDHCDYTINNQIVGLGLTVPSSSYSRYVVNPIGCVADIDAKFRGELPDYIFDSTGDYPYPGSLVSGRIVNNVQERPFRILDVTIGQPSSPFAVYSFPTGDITGTEYIVLESAHAGLSDTMVALTLSTNFGDVPVDFLVSGDYTEVPDIYLSLSPLSPTVRSNSAKSFTAEFAYYPSGAPLFVSLSYNGGVTGNIYYFAEQTGAHQYQNVSGTITGFGYLQSQFTGLVSGLDPLTSIWESATGTGILRSDLIVSTGFVQSGYQVNVYGLGDGFLTTNYLASGYSSGYYAGNVGVEGEYLLIEGYNFTGQGESPGVATGIVPTGTSRALIFPTGCINIASEGLVYGTDFYSGTLSATQAYEGQLVIDYSVLAIGWGTGEDVSGVVDSKFALNFVQGNYYFWKTFSGTVSGDWISTGSFNPVDGSAAIRGATGTISDEFYLSNIDMLCSSLDEMPSFTVTGIPPSMTDSEGNSSTPSEIYTVQPLEGFGVSETSDRAIEFGDTRTTTSRMGISGSGSGVFYNPVTELSSVGIDEHYWKEKVPSTYQEGYFDDPSNSIGFVQYYPYLSGTGNLIWSASDVQDSGVLHFEISGEGKKSVALRGFSLTSNHTEILQLALFKNGTLFDYWEEVSIPPTHYEHYVEATQGIDAGDTVGITDLESGYYSLYVTSRTIAQPTVSFSQSVFSGCESAEHIEITVIASGIFRSPVWVEMNTYEESTAHSGVNYDPILLGYLDTGLLDVGYIPGYGNGGRYAGIKFPSSYPNGTGSSGLWDVEVKSYTFTIPIYENAAFGRDHEFDISLTNPSGATSVYPSTATVIINENDNINFVYDELGVTGAYTSGVSPNCVAVSRIVPPAPEEEPYDPCFDGGDCENEASGSEATPPSGCDAYPCCSCASVTLVTGNCPGWGDKIFSGIVGTPGTLCGNVTVAGEGATYGYVYAGQMCCSGARINHIDFSGSCLDYDVVSYALYGEGWTRENECATGVSWTGCDDLGTTCSGADGAGHDFGDDQDYFDRPTKPKGKRPKGPACSPLLVFVKVTDTLPCSLSFHGVSPWSMNIGCRFPVGSPSLACPPKPPRL